MASRSDRDRNSPPNCHWLLHMATDAGANALVVVAVAVVVSSVSHWGADRVAPEPPVGGASVKCGTGGQPLAANSN